MKITELYGPYALPFFEWYLQNDNQDVFYWKYKLSDNWKEVHALVDKAAKFLNQPMSIDMFVRLEEPKDKPYPKTGKQYLEEEAAHKAWQNWKPLFEGGFVIQATTISGGTMIWRETKDSPYGEGVVIIDKDPIMTLNDFLTEVKGLKWNKDYEI